VRSAPATALRCLVGCYLAGVWLLAVGAAFAQPQPAGPDETNREYAIKAAYIYNFGRYVEWPPASFPDSQSPFVIGVLGSDPFGALLDEIVQSKKIEGRPIAARRFASMAEYRPCHILFVSAAASPEQKLAAIKMAQDSPVLLVGEDPGLAERGATINFFIEQNKIRFEINAEAARREQLKISSKLLSLAKIVGEK
jgi:hypothetical protein